MQVQKIPSLTFKGVIKGKNHSETTKLDVLMKEHSDVKFRAVYPEAVDMIMGKPVYKKGAEPFIVINDKAGRDLDIYNRVHGRLSGKIEQAQEPLNQVGEMSMGRFQALAREAKKKAEPYEKALQKLTEGMNKRAEVVDAQSLFKKIDDTTKSAVKGFLKSVIKA